MTNGTVHVWTVDLEVEAAILARLLDWLSGDERVRAARLRTSELRRRFIVAHGAVREILARYLGAAPDQLRFETTALGKPSVADSPLAFNLSHCDGLALCAVSAEGRIGVDLERIRPVVDAEAIVKRYFAASEIQKYQLIPAAARADVFFSTWTRKEAFLKATGMGLRVPLDSFEVDMSPAQTSPRLLVTRHALPDEPVFHLRAFTPRPQFAAAVALDREIEALEFFEWALDSAARALPA